LLSLLLVVRASAQADRPAAPLIRLRAATFDPVLGEPRLPAALTLDDYPAGQPGPFIVQFAGPVQPAWKQQVLDAGARLLDYVPDYAFVAWMDQAARQRVAALACVRWVGIFQPWYKLHPGLTAGSESRKQKAEGRPEDSDLPTAYRLLPSEVVIQTFPVGLPGDRFNPTPGSARLSVEQPFQAALVDAAGLVELARRPEVAWIEPARPRRLFNAASRGVMQVAPAWSDLGLFGRGQIVAVADTGLDVGTIGPEMSDDFEGRIISAYAPNALTARCTQSEWSDQDGHGTHVAGSILGSGVLSGSDPAAHQYADSLAGVAPEASLVIQAVFDHAGDDCFPVNLNDLFRPAYESGARIHSDSWGSSSAGEYDRDARQTDEFAWNHPDMTLVVAAGNDGVDDDQDGVIDHDSIASPGTAKNVLTVGAGEGDRPPDLGHPANIRWGDVTWGDNVHYSADPIRGDYISDNPGGVAAFSSRGPTDDGRIKPDVVAPGTNIISARSHLAGAGDLWGSYNSDYVYSGGTSMAAPLVAGAAALVRQFFVERQGMADPSAALVKATLINGAVDLTPGQYGFGQADGPTVFFDNLENGTDNWRPDSPWALTTDAFHSPYHAWTDSPDGDYQNNADTALSLARPIDLSSLTVPGLIFWHRYQFESGYDYGHVEASTDGGANWVEVNRYTGSQANWTRGQASLGRFAGQPAVWLRFRLTSDESVRRDGWIIDDVAVGPLDVQEVRGRPDFTQGWGRVSLADSLLPHSPRAAWFDDHRQGLETSQQVVYTAGVTSGVLPLRVTLAWTDYPGSTFAQDALVNDLDLVVEGPDGRLYHGNGGTGPDRLNNVEGVEISRPPRGLYIIRVTAANVPQGPQPYALVVSGPFIPLSPRVYLPILQKP
jgi:subtilisin family serine protease